MSAKLVYWHTWHLFDLRPRILNGSLGNMRRISRVHRVARAKICPNRSETSFTRRMHSHEREGKGLPTSIVDARSVEIPLLPPSALPLSIYLSIYLFIHVSRSLPSWYIERKFFPFSKEALGCLFKAAGLYCAFKRKRYIIEQPPSTDTWSRATGRQCSREQWNFWRTAKRPEDTSALTSEKPGKCFPLTYISVIYII